MNSNCGRDCQPEKENNSLEDQAFRDEEEERVELYDCLYSEEANKKSKKNTPNLSEESSKKSTKLTNKNSSDDMEETKEKCIIESFENNSKASKNETNLSPLFPILNNLSLETNNSFLGKKIKDSGSYQQETKKETKIKTFGCDGNIKDDKKDNKNKKNHAYQENFYKLLSPEREGINMVANKYYGNEDDILDSNEYNFESNIKEDFCEEEKINCLENLYDEKEKLNFFDYQADEEEKLNIPYYQDNGEGK